MKNTNFKIVQALSLIVLIFYTMAFAKDVKDIDGLTKCVCAGNLNPKNQLTKEQGGLVCLEELKDVYFKDNKYSDFVQTLQGLCPGNKEIQTEVNYYLALTRYSQLRYLEEIKSWDEYFTKGNDYRQDIIKWAKNAISSTSAKDPTHIHALLLLYQFHKDTQDAFSDAALTDLLSSIPEYAQSGKDIKTIKEVADKLLSYNEKGQAKELYKIYAQKLTSSDIKDAELKNIAVNFYKEGNTQLAENIYDIYIERILKSLTKEKLIQELTGIARDFAYKDNGQKDIFYAESIFKKIDELGSKDALNEELMYLRGFNLEKAKAYAQVKDIYVDFIKRFPKSSRVEEVTYKTGVIFIYLLRDLNSGRSYLEQLVRNVPVSTYSLAALYQLAVLKEWEGDSTAAKEYYEKITQNAADIDAERLALTQTRLKEIEENKPLDYNLKIGLDAALKEQYANLDMSRVELKANSYQPQKNKEVTIASSALLGSSGCFQVELQYLWSGDLGGLAPSTSQPDFNISYKSPGTKVIILVLVSPTGVTERSFDLIDVY